MIERIKQRLEALDLTSEGASKKAGLDRSYLRALFERNASPTVKTLAKLASALETTPEWLMLGSSETLQVQPFMENSISFRIRERLKTLDLTEEGASKKAGLDRGYVRQLLRRNGKGNAESMAKLAHALETTPGWLLNGTHEEHQAIPSNEVSTASIEMPAFGSMPRDIPVFGSAAASHKKGASKMDASIIDYVRRPPGLSTAKNVYGLYVEGDSMQPIYHAGDLLIMHPDRPARISDMVVVQSKTNNETHPEATIGILYKNTNQIVELQKFNPPAIIAIDKKNVDFIHRVLTMNDLFGV